MQKMDGITRLPLQQRTQLRFCFCFKKKNGSKIPKNFWGRNRNLKLAEKAANKNTVKKEVDECLEVMGRKQGFKRWHC